MLGVFLLMVGGIFTLFALVAFIAEHIEKHDPQLTEDFRRIWDPDYIPVDDDEERKQADHDWWDRRKTLEERQP